MATFGYARVSTRDQDLAGQTPSWRRPAAATSFSDGDSDKRRRQEEALDEALENTFPAFDPVSVEQSTTSGRAYRSW